jgi:hypothetical protein
MVVYQKAVKDEFLNNFYEAYDKYFKDKPYLFKKGDRWSVWVGFTQAMYPHQPITFAETRPDTEMLNVVITLEQDLLLSMLAEKKSKKEMTDNEGGYLVERYFAQEGAKDETIKQVAELTKQFVNDVLAIQNNNFVAV